jgi:myo-inositol-1-phosphate synthase
VPSFEDESIEAIAERVAKLTELEVPLIAESDDYYSQLVPLTDEKHLRSSTPLSQTSVMKKLKADYYYRYSVKFTNENERETGATTAQALYARIEWSAKANMRMENVERGSTRRLWSTSSPHFQL